MTLAALPALYLAALLRHDEAEEVLEAVRAAVDGGTSRDEAIAIVVELLDWLTPIEVLLPGPAGAVAEAALDQAITRTAERLVDRLAQQHERAVARRRARRARRGIGAA